MFVPLTLTSAPVWPAWDPAPLSVNGRSEPAPCSWRAAPLATVTPEEVPRAPVAWRLRMPALTAVAPLKVLATAKVRAPASFLVSVPMPESAVVLTEVFPAPAKVRLKVAPVTPPVRVRVPASEAIVVAAPSVMAPESVFAPPMLRMAPGLAARPVPLIVSASATERFELVPSISRTAPEVTVVPCAVAPRALLFWTRRAPALIVVRPV